jgi:hypothetical protein
METWMEYRSRWIDPHRPHTPVDSLWRVDRQMYLQRGAGHERQMATTLDPLRNDQRDNCQKSAANLVASF